MRFYEQPVLGCFRKTVTKTCSNNVVSSNCVMLSWPWYTLIIIRRWILDRLRRMLWIYCFEMFWRWDLRTDIFAGTVRHGWHESMTTNHNYGMALHVAGEKKVRMVQGWNFETHQIPESLQNSGNSLELYSWESLGIAGKSIVVVSWKRFCRKTCL